jgi:hypothetical protein
MERYPCPCCDFLTFPVEPGGTYAGCPVCFWEDDADDFNEPDKGHLGPNYRLSLNQCRENFRRIGANRPEDLPHVRAPLPEEIPPVAH